MRKGRRKKQQPQPQQPQPNNNNSTTHDNDHNNSHTASAPHPPFITPPRPARSPAPPDTAPPATTTAAPNHNGNKADLAHLVGRPLVPFFLDNGSENTSQQPATVVGDGSDGRQWGVSEDGRGVPVRQFVDGYFVDVGTIGGGQLQDGRAQHTPRTAPVKGGGKGGKGKGKAAAAPTSATAIPSAIAAVSYSAAVQQAAPNAKRTLHPAPSPPAPSTPLPAAPPAKYGAPAFTNSPSPMKVPLPKFLKEKTAAGSVGSVPAISEEAGGYVRGPSLMHLLQQQAEEEEEGQVGEAESDSNGHDSFGPISLMHLLQPQPQTIDTVAHDATLLHSATSVPVSSFSPSFIPPFTTSTATHPTTASSSSDVPLSMPKLLFLRQSSIDETNTVVTTVPLDSPNSASHTLTTATAASAITGTHSPSASFHHPTVNDTYLPPTSFPLHNGSAAASYPLPSPHHSLPIFNSATSASTAATV